MALSKLGVTRELPDQVSGVIIEKDGQGEPTGLLGAVNSVFSNDEFAYELWRKVPVSNFDLVLPATRRAIAMHHRLGVTAIYENHFMQRRQINVYRKLRDAGELPIRLMVAEGAEFLGSAWAQPRESDGLIRALEAAADSVEQTDELFR